MSKNWWVFDARQCLHRLVNREYRTLASVYPNGDWYLFGYGEQGPVVTAWGHSESRSYREGKTIVERKIGGA